MDTEPKYFITADYNNCTTQTLDAKIKQKELVDKFSIDGFIKNAVLNKKVAILATNAELKAEQDKIAKLQAFDSSYIRDKINFEDNCSEIFLQFQPM